MLTTGAPERAKSGDKHLGERCRVSSVWIQIRVKDGDLRTRGSRCQRSQQFHELLWIQSTGIWTVDGRHKSRVEDIYIHMEPISVQFGSGDHVGDQSERSPHVARDIACGDQRAQDGVGLSQVLVVVAAPDVRHVCGPEIGTVAVNVTDIWPMEANSSGEVFAGHACARVTVAGVTKVRVSIGVDEPESSASTQRKS